MKDLIEALNIFLKYIPDLEYPLSCEHDTLYVNCSPALIDPDSDDEERLYQLSFVVDEQNDCFRSFRFGSS